MVELLGQRDDDALGAADVAEPVAVLVERHLSNEFRAVSAQAGDVLDVVDGEHDPMQAERVRRRVMRSGADRRGVWYFVSSIRPWPSGVRIIAMSTRTPSSALTRSTHRPSTSASPSSSTPSSTKKP